MRIFQMLSALYNATGYGDTKVCFFKTLFNEITAGIIDYSSFPSDVTIRMCFTKEEKGRQFYLEAANYIHRKNVKAYFSEFFDEENTIERFRSYLVDNDIVFDEDDKSFIDAVTDEFIFAFCEKLYYDDSDKIIVKNILKKIQVLYDSMMSTGSDIYKSSTSVYSNYLPNSRLRELRVKIIENYKKFQNANDELLSHTTKYPRLIKLYTLSLEVNPELIGNPFNIPESNNRYVELLNSILENF